MHVGPTSSRTTCRRTTCCPMRRVVTIAILCLAGVTSVACGHGHHGHGYHHHGTVVVDNQTHTTTNEMLVTFQVAPFQLPFTGDLLGGTPIDPAEARFLGEFGTDYYDARGDLELGQVIEWFDEFVGNGDTTFFVVL